MKYVRVNDALVSMSEKDWKAFCKIKVTGDEADLPGKLLEYEIIDITDWDREDYAKALGLDEVPSDLPSNTEKEKRPTKRRATSKRSKVSRPSNSSRQGT